MKTPEEIKKGLGYCASGSCGFGDCPYKADKRGLEGDYVCRQECEYDTLALINQLEDHIRDLTKKVPKWVSVEERLPEKGQTVMVCGVKNGMQVGAFRGTLRAADNRVWSWKKDSCLTVTHWMPLPTPPEASKEG